MSSHPSIDESAEVIAERILEMLNISEASEEMSLEDIKRNIFDVETSTNIMLIEGLDTLALENKRLWNPSVVSPPKPPPMPRTIRMRRPSTASDYFGGKKKKALSPKRPTDKTPRGGRNYVSSRKFTPRGGSTKDIEKGVWWLAVATPCYIFCDKKAKHASP